MSELTEDGIVDGLASELVATRDQLEVVLRNVAEGVTVLSRDGRFVYANEAAARLIGYRSAEELMQAGFGDALTRFEIFADDGAPLDASDLPGRRALAGERPPELVVRFRPVAGGAERVSVVRAVPVQDDAGAVQLVINFFREITEERRREARDEVIAEAGRVVGSSLDLEATLHAVADLAVPRLADWCVVELLDAGGELRRVAAVHAEPAKAAASAEMQRRWPRSIDDVNPAAHVVVTGAPELHAAVTDDDLVALARDDDHLRALRDFGAKAVLAAPVVAHGRVLGSISFGLTTTRRTFAEADVEVAADLGRRAAIAIENARLFGETRGTAALLDSLFAAAPVGLGVWDRELRFVRLNQALADINGVPLEEHIGRTLPEVVGWLEPHIYDAYRHVLATGETLVDVETSAIAPSQPALRRTWIASYYPVRDGGEIAGVGAVVSEVTARRQAERRLAVQHAVTRIIADAARVGDAAPQMLEAMCELLDWDVGAFWPVRRADEASARYVHAPPELAAFAEATLGHRVRPGVSLAGEIWGTASPRWIRDMTARADFPQAEEARAAGLKTGFGFPALAAGEVVGIIEFFAREEREPDAELLAVVETLGRSIGQFVRRRRAEAERGRLLVAERLARSEAEAAVTTLRKLEEVAAVTLAHLSLRELLDALLARIVDVLAADTAAILLLDDSGARLRMRATVGLGEELADAIPIQVGEGIAGTVAASRAPLLVDDLDEVDLVSPVLRERGIRALIAIPLVVEDRVIGVVHAGSEERARFSYEDARLLELIADRIALAINQVTLYEAEREARARLRLVAEASATLGSSLDVDETLRRVSELATGGFADLVAVDLADGDEIVRVAVEVSRPELEGEVREALLANPPSHDDVGGPAAALRSGEPQILLDVTGETLGGVTSGRPGVRPALGKLAPRSIVYMPLVARGHTLGVLAFVRTERPFTERDVETAQELASRAAVAVENARLYQAAEEGRERLGFLAEASALLGSALHPEEALAELGNLVVGRIADWCSIHLVDEAGAPRLVAIAHTDPARAAAARAWAEELEPPVESEVGVAAVVRRGESELWPEIPRELLSGPPLEAGIHSSLIVPLVARGRTLGALTLVWAETDRKYGESDLEFAEDLARRAAVAIDNAQLYREAAERAQAARVLASVGDGVVLVDNGGVVRYWNRAAAAITGLEHEDVIERRLTEIAPGWTDVAERVPLSADAAATPRAVSLPVLVGERELWLSVSGVAVPDGVVYAFRDLTEERALEQLKTEFVSTVSHELRTPLAAIYGAAMTLRRTDVSLGEAQSGKLLGVISNEADRLARIVNDILWASRIDSDTVKMSIGSCDGVALVQEVVTAQRMHLPEATTVEVVEHGTLPPVAADPDKVRQVLVNLVENAVKYSPDGGRVVVTISSGGGNVRFAVGDEGLGIPHPEQRRIFEKFYRLDPNMTRGIGGTGLGLYISRELVRRMGGRIWVVSEPGRGSTFSFELPVAGGEPDLAAHSSRFYTA